MEEGWMEVFLTAQEYKATMAKDILENEGIDAVVMNQHDSAYKSFGDYVVYVKEADKLKALELLKKLKH
jgi:isopentenyldiphosphate isomerase